MYWKWRERKNLWPILMYFLNIYLEGLRETMKNLIQGSQCLGQDLNPGHWGRSDNQSPLSFSGRNICASHGFRFGKLLYSIAVTVTALSKYLKLKKKMFGFFLYIRFLETGTETIIKMIGAVNCKLKSCN